MKKLLIISLFSMTALSQTSCLPVIIAGGAGAAGYTASQERPVKQTLSDTNITASINMDYLRDAHSEDLKNVKVNTVEGRVLLTGFVPTQEAKINAYNLAWKIQGVTQVINEVRVEKNTQFSAKQAASDSWISTQIGSRLLFAKDVQSVNYSVETIRGVVYLMGIAQNKTELEKVTDIASKVSGVQKVVSYVRIKGSSQIEGVKNESGNPVSVEEQQGTLPGSVKASGSLDQNSPASGGVTIEESPKAQ